MPCFCSSLPLTLWLKVLQQLKAYDNTDIALMIVSLCPCDSLNFLLSTSLNHPPISFDESFGTLSEILEHLRSTPPGTNSVRFICEFVCEFLLPIGKEQKPQRLKKFREFYATVKLEIHIEGLRAKIAQLAIERYESEETINK
jgi:hypothetical protein